MTKQDTDLLNRNFTMSILTILTIIGCTATFVWKGSEYAQQISMTQRQHTEAINSIQADNYNLHSENNLQNNRLTILETKMQQ